MQEDLHTILDLALLFADDDAIKQVLENPSFTAATDPQLIRGVQFVRLFHKREHQQIVDLIDSNTVLTFSDMAILGRAYHALDQSDVALDKLEQILNLDHSADPHGYLSAVFRHARILVHYGRYSEALRDLAMCEALSERVQSPSISSLIMKDLATIAVNTGDPVKAIMYAERSLSYLENTERSSHKYAYRKINLASLYVSAGRLQDALTEYEELVNNPIVLASAESSLVAFLNLAITYKRLGRSDDSLKAYQQVVSIAEKAHQHEFIVRALVGITDHYVIVGDLERARSSISEAINYVAKFDLRSMEDLVNIHVANVDHALGLHESAITLLRSCYDRFSAEQNVRDTVLYGGDLAEWLAESGRYQEAFDVLKHCSALQRSVYDQEIERTIQLSSLRTSLDVERESIRQRDEARTAVLHSVLPAHIAQRLLTGERKIGERVESVSILFADIVGFTKMSALMEPEQLVDLLEELFTKMDQIALEFDCERIKTIGDSYMAACGLADATSNHVERICRTAQAFIDDRRALPIPPSQFRIGLHTGPVVAGVMSGSKLSYDIWGDTVNVASRMENHSSPGRILCSSDVANVLMSDPTFQLEKREPLDIRGKGLMTTYWLGKLSV